MGLLKKALDLDARGGSILPASTETRTEFLTRLAAHRGRGVVAPAVSLMARELLDQDRRIAELEARVAQLDKR